MTFPAPVNVFAGIQADRRHKRAAPGSGRSNYEFTMENRRLRTTNTPASTTRLRVIDFTDPASHHMPDPIFAVIHALDQAAERWSAAFLEWLLIMDRLDPEGCRSWDDPDALARQVLGLGAGPTIRALRAIIRRLEELDPAFMDAEDAFVATKPTSEIGVAAYRAAARRAANRPGRWEGDEAAMLKSLDTMLAA